MIAGPLTSSRFLPPEAGRFRRNIRAALALAGALLFVTTNHAQVGWAEYLRGDYPGAIETARSARADDAWLEDAWRVEAEALLASGRAEEAYQALEQALRLVPSSLRLRLLAEQAARVAGRPEEAAEQLAQLSAWVTRRTRAPDEAAYFVALGEAALRLGVEPRLVLENFLRRGRESTPPVREAFLAIGRLALEKGDPALASRTFEQGVQTFPEDPDLWAGLAAAFLDGDRTKLVEYAERALTLNPRHTPARLLLAEHRIDAEDYAGAAEELDQIEAVYPDQPEALALRAVLAHLRADEPEAAQYRAVALAVWRDNPQVDHLIGRKLSQKYRFTEGAAAQRRALEIDPEFGPARIQLAQDLLRLGREEEGWSLAAAAQAADAYDVTAFNLTNLRERLDDFTVFETPRFRLRMGAAEAPIYGERALALLERAYAGLSVKYGLELTEPVVVDVFPDPRDFAVRTFGMPDRPGFLGVCFGQVVTINSPASSRANWEAVLWHEFAHVITLSLTRNRMPRWLSEGISVYEERCEHYAWGHLMTESYRERILSGRMQPISAMSAAFLQARDGEDLQFAYFQSAMVVEFLIAQHGFPALRAVLAALRDDVPINEALARHCAPLDELDAAFVVYARKEALALGAGLDLSRPENPVDSALAELNPRHFPTRLERARAAAERDDWSAAKNELDSLLGLADGIYLPGPTNAHRLLARANRELGDAAAERAALLTVAERESDALDAVTRLLELAELAGDAPAAARWADRWLAINPLAAAPWRALFAARERLADAPAAVAAGRVLLRLDPPDRPAIHIRVAHQLRPLDPDAARRHVLLALAEAPRSRAAHALLAELPATPDVSISP